MCARELSGYPSGCFKTCGKMKGLWLRSLGAPGNRFAQPILQHEQEGLNHQKNVCLQEGWGAAAAVATSLASHYSLLENVSLAASLQLQMKAEHGEDPDSVGRRTLAKAADVWARAGSRRACSVAPSEHRRLAPNLPAVSWWGCGVRSTGLPQEQGWLLKIGAKKCCTGKSWQMR